MRRDMAMGTNLVFEADDIVAIKRAMQDAGFEQNELDLLAGSNREILFHQELWKGIRTLVNGQATAINTTHVLPPKDGETEGSTIERRGEDLYHNGRRLGVLHCRKLKDVSTYADLAAYFKPEAHPPEEVLVFLDSNPRMVPGNWDLYGQRLSWVIFMSTRRGTSVDGLHSEPVIGRGHWDGGDGDGLEKNDKIVVYADAI